MSYARFTESIEKVRRAAAELDPSVIKQLIDEHKDMFTRFCPFKAGSRVRLVKTPEINEKDSWGWMGSKHFLVAGITGTVDDVSIYRGKFRAGVVWDIQTWINRDTKQEIPQEPPYIYGHSEEWLEVIK